MKATAVPLYSARSREAEEEYRLGLVFFRKQQWRRAAWHFSLAATRVPRRDAQLYLYRSWHGLALVYCRDLSGLNLCRHAVAQPGIQATVFRNLVLAELKLNHRRRACEALEQGLQLDPGHRGLLELTRQIPARRRPCLAFLKREHPLNRWLGKLTYRRMKRLEAQG